MKGTSPRKHILLVEDDDAVRSIFRRALQMREYVVTEAASALEALKLLDPISPPAIDLLLTDLEMPGMGGAELAERVRAILPGTPMLFMSGHAAEDVKARVGKDRFISKPFGLADLLERVREAIDAPVAGAPPASAPVPRDLGGTTVLVMDDEPEVRLVIQRILEVRGCRVLDAADVQEAVHLIAATPPDLVIVDLVLPGMEGREAANLVLARLPSVPILFVSGYTRKESLRLGWMTENQAFLRKPFGVEGLVGAVKGLLDRAG